jgi:hypothetical protein
MWKREVEELRRRREQALEMGGEEGIRQQHQQGKLTVRERIDRFLDDGTFSIWVRANFAVLQATIPWVSVYVRKCFGVRGRTCCAMNIGLCSIDAWRSGKSIKAGFKAGLLKPTEA